MYRYYKGADKRGTWRYVPVEDEQSKLESPDVAFATVLAVSEAAKFRQPISPDATYQGPFYIDIDADEGVVAAIVTARKAVNALLKLGLSEHAIQVWASGKRGFHITVPMEAFTTAQPTKNLPYIYKLMAQSLNLDDAFDGSVYSSGKGRMWRLPNKERPDNGHYKVPVSIGMLRRMTAEDYDDWTSQPRSPINGYHAIERSSMMGALFAKCQERAGRMEVPKGIFIDPNLKAALGSDLPPCMKDVLSWNGVRDSVGFNAVSLQFAKGVASFAPDDAEELLNEFAENAHGISYNTPHARLDHVNRAFHVAVKNKSYDWSCTSALSVLDHEPCSDCPIAFIRHQALAEEKPEPAPEKPAVVAAAGGDGGDGEDDDGEAESAPNPEQPKPEAVSFNENNEDVIETTSGYVVEAAGGRRRISNFILRVRDVFVQYVENIDADRRVAARVEVMIGGNAVGSVFVEEINWDSKAGFKASFSGLANVAFYGFEDDVARVKSVLLLNIERHATLIRRVYAAGIHSQRVGEQLVFSYTEPGWSIDQMHNQNLMSINGRIPAHPQLKNVRDMPRADPQVSALLRNLLKMNHPHRIAPALGWSLACFLKQHIFSFRNEFPLLSLHGKPGSGKTQTAAMVTQLHGVDFRSEYAPMSLPNSSDFVLWKFIASSTTAPRLLEEFNKSKLGQRYPKIAEILKACWNQHTVDRGTIKGNRLYGEGQMGAQMVSIHLTGPVALCSEQRIDMPALIERTVQVEFQKLRDGVDEVHKEAFFSAVESLSCASQFARVAYLEALELSPETIREWTEDESVRVPRGFDARPDWSYRVVFTGLRFLEHLALKHGLVCMEELFTVRHAFQEWLRDNTGELVMTKQVSEADIVVQKWASMAAMSGSEGQIPWLLKGQHYLRAGDRLYIDPLVAHAQYLRYMASVERAPAVIDNIREFHSLVRGEDYCLSTTETLEGFAKGRKVLLFSCSAMSRKGIPAEAFEESQ